MTLLLEHWRPVVEYEGLYEVSNVGVVRSLGRTIRRSDGRVQTKLPRVVKQCDFGTGYLSVRLFDRDGRKVAVGVQRVVLAAFVGPCPDGCEACHNNGNRADCRASNLRWDTHVNNCADRVAHGTHTMGENNGHCKLTVADVRLIRETYIPRHPTRSAAALARKFGITKTHVTYIVKRKNWTHVA